MVSRGFPETDRLRSGAALGEKPGSAGGDYLSAGFAHANATPPPRDLIFHVRQPYMAGYVNKKNAVVPTF